MKTPRAMLGAVMGAALGLGAAAPSSGELPESTTRPKAWGTADETIHTLNAFDFAPEAFSVETGIAPNYMRFIFHSPGPTGTLYSGLRLPAGALLTFVDVNVCDTDAAEDVRVGVYACADPAAACTLQGLSAGTVGTPGCVNASASLGDVTVDNLTQTYFVQVEMGVGLSNLLRSVKVHYRLQVSPDPAIQSFTDVPVSHPFHRYVEALYDAGITAGYPDGRFGVDDPITRGQMAVFLALALGLHFPN
ncbi:MAG TPA: S-layer homology domain-containing protein [Thermoanaerobaculia bacterium]